MWWESRFSHHSHSLAAWDDEDFLSSFQTMQAMIDDLNHRLNMKNRKSSLSCTHKKFTKILRSHRKKTRWRMAKTDGCFLYYATIYSFTSSDNDSNNKLPYHKLNVLSKGWIEWILLFQLAFICWKFKKREKKQFLLIFSELSAESIVRSTRSLGKIDWNVIYHDVSKVLLLLCLFIVRNGIVWEWTICWNDDRLRYASFSGNCFFNLISSSSSESWNQSWSWSFTCHIHPDSDSMRNFYAILIHFFFLRPHTSSLVMVMSHKSFPLHLEMKIL